MLLNDYEIEPRKTEVIKYESNDNLRLLQKFLIAKQVSGRSQKTLHAYREQIVRFLDEVQKPIREITADDIRYNIALHQMRDHWKKSTADNWLRYLKSFFKYLHNEGLISRNPTAKIESIKQTKIRKEAFTDLEIATMRNSLKSERERALFEFLLSTWCRVSEVTEVKISDIKGEQLTVHGKGDKYRKVYLNATARVAIGRYLAERDDNNPYLFISESNSQITKKGKPLSSSGIENVIREIGKRNGIKAHPHKFRRTGATMALRHGMDLITVSRILGHEDVGTTQVYLDIDDIDTAQQHHKYVN